MAARMMPQILSTQPQQAVQLVEPGRARAVDMPSAKDMRASHGFNREVESTDAGSSGSDAESGWSSASEAPQSDHRFQQRQQQERPKPQPLGQTKRQRPKPLAKRVRLQAGLYFRGTPLTPIPGTPKKQEAEFSSSGSDAEGVNSCKLQTPVEPVPPGAVAAPPGLPGSPKRRARQAMLEKARSEGIPLKVRIPEEMAKNLRSLDYTIPAKKRPPVWPGMDFGSAVNLLDPQLPAKKCLSPFLLASPCFVDL